MNEKLLPKVYREYQLPDVLKNSPEFAKSVEPFTVSKREFKKRYGKNGIEAYRNYANAFCDSLGIPRVVFHEYKSMFVSGALMDRFDTLNPTGKNVLLHKKNKFKNQKFFFVFTHELNHSYLYEIMNKSELQGTPFVDMLKSHQAKQVSGGFLNSGLYNDNYHEQASDGMAKAVCDYFGVRDTGLKKLIEFSRFACKMFRVPFPRNKKARVALGVGLVVGGCVMLPQSGIVGSLGLIGAASGVLDCLMLPMLERKVSRSLKKAVAKGKIVVDKTPCENAREQLAQLQVPEFSVEMKERGVLATIRELVKDKEKEERPYKMTKKKMWHFNKKRMVALQKRSLKQFKSFCTLFSKASK